MTVTRAKDKEPGRAKYWCFTLNNPTDADRILLAGFPADKSIEYLLYGNEIGESGTPHLQGFIAFSKRRRFGELKNKKMKPLDRAHLEVAHHPKEAAAYCKKDGDFIENGTLLIIKGARNDLDAFKEDAKLGELCAKELREKHSSTFAKYGSFCMQYLQDQNSILNVPERLMYGWQESLFHELKLEADPRKIIFCVDLIGNAGKTWFCHYTSGLLSNVQVINPGKKADMALVLDPHVRTLFMDATRSKTDCIQYDFLEEVKNQFVWSPKFWSENKILKRVPHVVVMMNEMPDMNKLSLDRYHILEVAPDR